MPHDFSFALQTQNVTIDVPAGITVQTLTEDVPIQVRGGLETVQYFTFNLAPRPDECNTQFPPTLSPPPLCCE